MISGNYWIGEENSWDSCYFCIKQNIIMFEIQFKEADIIEEALLYYAVIVVKFNGKLVLVRNRVRTTWEIPGGRREEGESINQTAHRELFEETGALDYTLSIVCDYQVDSPLQSGRSYGRLFYAEVRELGALPDSEIAELQLVDALPQELTHPHIQPLLLERVERWLISA